MESGSVTLASDATQAPADRRDLVRPPASSCKTPLSGCGDLNDVAGDGGVLAELQRPARDLDADEGSRGKPTSDKIATNPNGSRLDIDGRGLAPPKTGRRA